MRCSNASRHGLQFLRESRTHVAQPVRRCQREIHLEILLRRQIHGGRQDSQVALTGLNFVSAGFEIRDRECAVEAADDGPVGVVVDAVYNHRSGRDRRAVCVRRYSMQRAE